FTCFTRLQASALAKRSCARLKSWQTGVKSTGKPAETGPFRSMGPWSPPCSAPVQPLHPSILVCRMEIAMSQTPRTLTIGTGSAAREIAILRRSGANPGLFWLGGFRSDMAGSKAEALDALGADKGLA